jgi:oligopeptide/dipeptide ABC transporter ATP-binding protein
MSTIESTSTGRSDRDTVLEVRDVEVTFDMARGRARVLDDVSIDLVRGESLGIAGESGCGKSTFASTLMNAVEEPGVLRGEILYYPERGDPIDITELNERQLRRFRWEEVAIASQDAMNAFNPTLTIRRHFTETFEAHDTEREEGLAQARETLKQFNLEPDRILDAHQHDLSGGEKQRAMLALSLVFNPEILILDEPTAGLDLLAQRRVLGLLRDIKEEYDLTVLFISHDMQILSGFADRIAVMYAFDFIERGSVRDVILSPDHPYTRLLAGATLDLSTPYDEVQMLEGDTPDPINVPQGCSFHPRCPISDDRCEVEEPELRSSEESDHEVACFFPNVAKEQIPVAIEREEESR